MNLYNLPRPKSVKAILSGKKTGLPPLKYKIGDVVSTQVGSGKIVKIGGGGKTDHFGISAPRTYLVQLGSDAKYGFHDGIQEFDEDDVDPVVENKAILSGKKTPGTPPVPQLMGGTAQIPMTDMGEIKSEEPNKLHLDNPSHDTTFNREFPTDAPAEEVTPLPTQEEMFEQQLAETPHDPDLLGVVGDYYEERGDPKHREYRERAMDIDPLSGQPGYRSRQLQSALGILLQDFGDRQADEFREAVDNRDEETIHDFLNILEKAYGGRNSMQFHPRGKRVLKWMQELEKWFPRQNKMLFPKTGITVKSFYTFPRKKKLSKFITKAVEGERQEEPQPMPETQPVQPKRPTTRSPIHESPPQAVPELEQAVYDNPTDTDQVGVWADSLEEAGDPRAEIVRNYNTVFQLSDEFMESDDDNRDATIMKLVDAAKRVGMIASAEYIMESYNQFKLGELGNHPSLYVQDLRDDILSLFRREIKYGGKSFSRRKAVDPIDPDATVLESHNTEIPTTEPALENFDSTPTDMPPVEPIVNVEEPQERKVELDIESPVYIHEQEEKPHPEKPSSFHDWEDSRLASVTGIEGLKQYGLNVNVNVKREADRVTLDLKGPEVFAFRSLRMDQNGVPFIYNESQGIETKSNGLGTVLLYNQVEVASKAGFEYLFTMASGDFSMALHGMANGHITWAKLGYSCSVEDLDKNARLLVEVYFPDAEELMDVIQTKMVFPLQNDAEEFSYAREEIDELYKRLRKPPGNPNFLTGEEWWLYYGSTFAGKFDLKQGSKSRRQLNTKIEDARRRLAKRVTGSKTMKLPSKSPQAEQLQMPPGWNDTGWSLEEVMEDIAEGVRRATEEYERRGTKAIEPTPIEQSNVELPLADSIDAVEPVLDTTPLDMPEVEPVADAPYPVESIPRVAQRPVAPSKLSDFDDNTLESFSGLAGFQKEGVPVENVQIIHHKQSISIDVEGDAISNLLIDLKPDSDHPGKYYLYNSLVFFNEAYKGKGIGTAFVAAQAKAAAEAGLSRIGLLAVGNFKQAAVKDTNGYYSWAVTGTNCKVKALSKSAFVQACFPDAIDLIDVLASPQAKMDSADSRFLTARKELDAFAVKMGKSPGNPNFLTGKEWWLYFGSSFSGSFDLSFGSKSWKRLHATMQSRKKGRTKSVSGTKAMRTKQQSGGNNTGWWAQDIANDVWPDSIASGTKAIDPTEEPDANVVPLSDPIDPVEPVQQMDNNDAVPDQPIPDDEPEPQRISEQQQWVDAISADPTDDSLKLVYADWLEEQGNPDADIIRGMATNELTQEQWNRLGNIDDDLQSVAEQWVDATYPQARNVASTFSISLDKAAAVAHLMDKREFGGGELDVDGVLDRINSLVGGYGVEAVEGQEWNGGYYGNIVALYVNTSDTYDPTVLYDVENDEFVTTHWRDWYEAYQQEHPQEDEDAGPNDENPLNGVVVSRDDANWIPWQIDNNGGVPSDVWDLIAEDIAYTGNDEGDFEYDGQVYVWQRQL